MKQEHLCYKCKYRGRKTTVTPCRGCHPDYWWEGATVEDGVYNNFTPVEEKGE